MTKEQQLYKNKAPKITQHERDYLSWLQTQCFKCFVCGTSGNIEYHHITDIKRIKGKRRCHKRVVPLCAVKCHRIGKESIHAVSKEYYYDNIKSLEELCTKAETLYVGFTNSKI